MDSLGIPDTRAGKIGDVRAVYLVLGAASFSHLELTPGMFVKSVNEAI
jgi:hypothetical protein